MSKNQEFWKKYHQDNDRKGTFMDVIKKHVETLKPKSILEIGCGIGNNLMIFEDFTNVVGIDISEYAIEIAKNRFPKFRFYVSDATKIPLNETFDLVFTCAVLEHIKPNDVEHAMQELLRVSNHYILNIEAYDKTEHEINWHRGRNEFWTLDMTKRWKNLPVRVLEEYNVHDEYRLTLVSKIN